jgi:hypothetical protein
MTSLAKVVLLFKALAMLLLLGCAVVAAGQWIWPSVLPLEFAAYYSVGAIGVVVAVALGALLTALKAKTDRSD